MKQSFATGYIRSIAIAVLCSISTPTFSAPIVTYNIPQTGSNYISIPPSGVATDISASTLAATNTLTPNTFGNHFYFRNWNTTINSAKYYQNTLTVAPGKTLFLTDVSYSVEATNPVSFFSVRSSLDGFTSDIDLFAANGVVVTNRTSNLTGLGPITGAITFRFYATAPNPGARMGFANHLPGAAGAGSEIPGRNIQFSGLVVPEPASLLLGLIACIGLCAPQRSRNRIRRFPD